MAKMNKAIDSYKKLIKEEYHDKDFGQTEIGKQQKLIASKSALIDKEKTTELLNLRNECFYDRNITYISDYKDKLRDELNEDKIELLNELKELYDETRNEEDEKVICKFKEKMEEIQKDNSNFYLSIVFYLDCYFIEERKNDGKNADYLNFLLTVCEMLLQNKPPSKMEYECALLCLKLCEKKGDTSARQKYMKLMNDPEIRKIIFEKDEEDDNKKEKRNIFASALLSYSSVFFKK